MKKQNSTFRENLRLEISASLLLSFTFFLFGPLEIMLTNPIEFHFTVLQVIDLFLSCTAACFIITMGIQYLISFAGNRILKICSSLLAALGFCFYIQGNWTFIDYGEMTGTPISWNSYSQWAVKNTVMWILILIIVVCSINYKVRYLTACTYIMLGIVGTEALTLGFLFTSTINKAPNIDFTLEGGHEFQLSSNQNNIIVIVADGFDGQDFLPVLEEEPDLRQHFDGFTFYEDTCGTSLYSEESGITLLTGNQLEVGPTFSENIATAYKNTDLYDILAQNHYDTYLYVRAKKMVSPEIGEQVANFRPKKEHIDKTAAFQELYKMVAFRYMPHIAKKYFWYSHTNFWEIGGKNSSLYLNYDMYDLIRKQGVIAEKTEHNIYQFYWIQGPHDPANTDRYCHKLDQTINEMDEIYAERQFEQTIGVVRMYTELLSALKRANVYDNTTVIFTADHGWDIRINPCLLVKPKNAHGDLIVSDVPVSMPKDYLPTLEYFITGEKSYGDTIYELDEEAERERVYYEYSVNLNGFDRTYNSRTEMKLNKNRAFSKDVTLGTTLMPDDIMFHSRLGLENSKHTNIRTAGNETILEFKIKEDFSDLLLELSYDTYNGIQPVQLYANDILVTEFDANGREDKSILIPGEYVTDGNLRLQFYWKNAILPAEIDPDNRTRIQLALTFYSMRLSDTGME